MRLIWFNPAEGPMSKSLHLEKILQTRWSKLMGLTPPYIRTYNPILASSSDNASIASI